MGSPNSEKGRFRDEGPQTKLEISRGFWIGKYPVTQGEWESVMGNNPSHFKQSGNRVPVENVSWKEVKEFCQKLNAGGGGKKGMKFRLPYEAEWEYACRAGCQSALYHGKELTTDEGRCPNLDEVAWYSKNSNSTTHPVGEKKPNDWGLYDCLGNVWEWTESWWQDNLPGGNVKD